MDENKLESLKNLIKSSPNSSDTLSSDKKVFVPTGTVEVMDYASGTAEPVIPVAETSAILPEKQNFYQKAVALFRKRPILIPLVLAVLFGIFAGAFWLLTNTSTTPKYYKLSVGVDYPKEIPIGSTREWVATIKNDNPVEITSVRATLLLDQNFKYQRDTSVNGKFDSKSTTYFLDNMQAGETKIVRFEAQVLGAIQETTSLQIMSEYTYSTTKKTESVKLTSEKFMTTIVNSDIRAEVTKQQELVEVNSDTTITFKFENVSDKDIENLRVRGLYPANTDFLYRSSSLDEGVLGIKLTPSESNNIWIIDKLPRKTVFTITVSGTVKINAKPELPFTFEIASLSSDKEWKKILEKSDIIKSTPQSLAVSTYINGATEFVKPGTLLEIVVEYENKSTKAISNVSITSAINDPASILDYSKLIVLTGTPTVTNKTLIWQGGSASELVSLAPGFKGTLRYTIPVKAKELAVNSSFNQDQYTLRPVAEVKQTDQQTISAASALTYKLVGGMNFLQVVELLDKNQSVFVGDSGDFKVNRVTWNISTLQNSLSAFDIVTGTGLNGLSDPIFNPTSIIPANYLDKLLYKQTDGAIVLHLDKVDNYLGISKAKLTISFQLKVPSGNQVNGKYDDIQVLKPVSVTGKDAVTGEVYKIDVPETLYKSTVPVVKK